MLAGGPQTTPVKCSVPDSQERLSVVQGQTDAPPKGVLSLSQGTYGDQRPLLSRALCGENTVFLGSRFILDFSHCFWGATQPSISA